MELGDRGGDKRTFWKTGQDGSRRAMLALRGEGVEVREHSGKLDRTG